MAGFESILRTLLFFFSAAQINCFPSNRRAVILFVSNRVRMFFLIADYNNQGGDDDRRKHTKNNERHH
ncbi:MAG: hypothetical protein A3I66_06020 [Burkholderiales bacterium RIFCSPLOWO2_02_FULL_57_36]|nr:MAG: hypothetical protein A3I66_06020 [Burkholderiales bacterium RIFCSPLOWO2_02_FULL_57_36]